MNSRRPAVPPWLAIFVGILAVSTASIFIRYAQRYAPSIVIAAWRLTLATLILLPPMIAQRKTLLHQLTRWERMLVLFSGIALAVHFGTWISSLEFTTVASSVVIVSTSPLFVALLSPLFLKEKLTWAAGIGLILALFGGLIVGLSDACLWKENRLICPPPSDFFEGKAIWGDFLALIGAIAAAIYLLIGRRLRPILPLGSYIFMVYGTAAVCLILAVLASRQKFWGYNLWAYIWFLLLALVPQLLGHSTFNWALGYLSAVFVAITLLGEPISSTLLAYFLLQEIPSGLKIFGAILILTGIFIAAQGEKHPRICPVKDAVDEFIP